jgi:steroid delta-isomerase-like uncharacterized protein
VTSEASTSQVVLAYLDAINAADATAAIDLVAEDFFNEHTSSLGHSLRGREAYAERLPRFLAEFEGLHYDVEDLIVDGDRAAVPYTMTFYWAGPDGAGRPVSIRGMFRFRVADGHIAHRVDYWDGAEFQRQTATSTGAT